MSIAFEPFLLSLVVGLATGIGGVIVLLLRRVGNRVVSFSMGFASGVMLMAAFNNLFLEAEKRTQEGYGCIDWFLCKKKL